MAEGFGLPAAVKFDAKGYLYVADHMKGEIHSDGTKKRVSPGGMIAPGGVAVMQRPNGESVFVADVFTLHEFDGLTGKERSIERNWIPWRPGFTRCPANMDI